MASNGLEFNMAYYDEASSVCGLQEGKRAMKKKKQKEKIRFYRLNDAVVVCLLQKNFDLARGIAVCSDEDKWDMLAGEWYSLHNARLAMGESRSLKPISNPNAIKVLIRTQCPFVHKGELNPVLTWREMAMLRLSSPFKFYEIGHERRHAKLVAEFGSSWGDMIFPAFPHLPRYPFTRIGEKKYE